MKKVHFFTSLIVFVILLAGCQFGNIDKGPEIVGPEPIPWIPVGLDSMSVEEYLNTNEPGAMYAALQVLMKNMDLNHLNMVGNTTSDLASLENRIPLYNYILLDEATGTSTGVQITLENGKVKAIYLNSGKKLDKWPESGSSSKTVQLGDAAAVLFGKFKEIKDRSNYAKKFERISLSVKEMTLPFDPKMSNLEQWYFAYKTGETTMETVEVYLNKGKGLCVLIKKFKQPGMPE